MRSVRFLTIAAAMFIHAIGIIAQKHDNIWLFGYPPNDPENYFGGSMLDFSVEPPSVYYFNIPIHFSASASISDMRGALVAYSNGCIVINRLHSMAQEGDSINDGFIHDIYCNDDGYPLGQGIIMIPVEIDIDYYRLLHIWRDKNGNVVELRSSDIILNDDSLAHVVNKNASHSSSSYARDISSTRHANGRDWWIVLPRDHSNVYEKFISNPDKVTLIDTQQIGTAWSNKDWSGQMTYSPDGRKFVRVNPFNGLHIFDFDRCSGELSNPVVIDFPGDTISASGAAFSPDSRFLYVSASLKVYQFDVTVSDIASSRKTVAVYDGFIADHGLSTPFYQQMLAPDGRIYISVPNSVRYLHIIHQPKEEGLDCKVEQHGLVLPALHAFSTPNFPHYRLGPLDGSPCDTLGLDNNPVAHFRHAPLDEDPLSVRFTDLSYAEPDTWNWSFGDNLYASGADQLHTYATPGTYEVCLEVSNQNSSDISCQWVTVTLTDIDDAEVINALQIAPNPFGDGLTVSTLDGQDHLVDITLYDMLGSIAVRRQNQSLPVQIETRDLNAAMYLCVVRADGGMILATKVIKK